MPAPQLTSLAAAALRVGEPERVLQVQCGDGDGALFLAREFPRARLRGVDGSERAIRRAAARIGLDPEGRIAFKVGRRGALPFPDDLFDLVALLDARPVAAEVARVMRPGGYLILASSLVARTPGGPAARLLWWRLSRHGVDLVETGAAGEGSFSVARLGDADRATPSD